MKNWLKPTYFFAGIILGFLICCLAGYAVSHKARFAHFNRFYNIINPQIYYYPTAHELLATAQHIVKDKNKVMVLIGGSSVFRGTGQNPEDVWSKELQKQLGKQYVVLNYGVDGGTFTSFGAVAFRMLIERYQKVIFVSTCSPSASPIDGIDIYRYLFWDAYYKKLFHPDSTEAIEIESAKAKQMTLKGMEQHILSQLDSHLYFQNLWNWMAYRVGFTVWSEFSGTTPFRARRRFVEPSTDLAAIRENVLKDASRFDGEVAMFAKIIEKSIDVNKTPLQMNPEKVQEARLSYEHAFSPRYRNQILCVLINENPRQLSKLSHKHLIAHDVVMKQTYKMLGELGYHAIAIGQHFLADDYFDGGHLYVSGGKKVAAEVAREVKKIALANGYITQS